MSALVATVEALPWIVVAFALYYAALYAGESTSLLGYRLLGSCLVLLGLVGAGIAALVLTQYRALPQNLDPETARMFRVMAAQAVGIGALHLVILIPIGVLGLRRPGVS